jgi:hypothetical protein
MLYLVLGGAVLAVLVWAGRRPTRFAGELRLASALFAAAAAVGAVVAALRGVWVGTVILVGLSAYLAQAARPPRTSRQPATEPTRTMSEAEARSLLGVAPNASRDEIEAAYRRLMLRAHPDQGGSAGLAAQLNAARDRLLKD